MLDGVALNVRKCSQSSYLMKSTPFMFRCMADKGLSRDMVAYAVRHGTYWIIEYFKSKETTLNVKNCC
jgi:hypothetical protein